MPEVRLDKSNWALAARILLESLDPLHQWVHKASEEQDTIHFDLDILDDGDDYPMRITLRWWDTLQEQIDQGQRQTKDVPRPEILGWPVLSIRMPGSDIKDWDLWGRGLTFADIRYALQEIYLKMTGTRTRMRRPSSALWHLDVSQ